MKQVFIPDNDGGRIVEQTDITVGIKLANGKEMEKDVYKALLNCLTEGTLKELLNKQIETENYEAAAVINEVLNCK